MPLRDQRRVLTILHAFLKISPNNKIPAIVDPEGPDGAPISVFESGAILIYLGEKTGRFWPEGMRRQVPVLEWLMFQMGGFGPFPGQVHHFVTVENEPDRRYALDSSKLRAELGWKPHYELDKGLEATVNVADVSTQACAARWRARRNDSRIERGVA